MAKIIYLHKSLGKALEHSLGCELVEMPSLRQTDFGELERFLSVSTGVENIDELIESMLVESARLNTKGKHISNEQIAEVVKRYYESRDFKVLSSTDYGLKARKGSEELIPIITNESKKQSLIDVYVIRNY